MPAYLWFALDSFYYTEKNRILRKEGSQKNYTIAAKIDVLKSLVDRLTSIVSVLQQGTFIAWPYTNVVY